MDSNQTVPPEVLRAFMQQLSLEEQDQELQQQLASQRELMGTPRYGAIGSGLQAGADIVNGLNMGIERGQRAKNRGQREAGRNTAANFWLHQGQQPQQPQLADPVPGLEDFSKPPPDPQAMIPALLRRPSGG